MTDHYPIELERKDREREEEQKRRYTPFVGKWCRVTFAHSFHYVGTILRISDVERVCPRPGCGRTHSQAFIHIDGVEGGMGLPLDEVTGVEEV